MRELLVIRRLLLVIAVLLLAASSWALNCAGSGSCFLNLGAVGCDGNTNTVACWTTTSGGAAGLGVPTSTDDCKLDGNSGAGTATVNATLACKGLIMTGFLGTLAGTSAINAGGNITLASTITYTGTLTLNATSGTQTFTSNGKTFTGNVTQSGAGGTVLMADAMNLGTKVYTHSNGIFDTGNNTGGGIVGGFAFSAAQWVEAANARSDFFNASHLTFTVPSGTGAQTVVSFVGTSGTFDFGHSLIEITNNSSTAGTKTIAGNVSGTVLYDAKVSGTGSSAVTFDTNILAVHDYTVTASGGATVNASLNKNTGAVNNVDLSAATATVKLAGNTTAYILGNVTYGSGVTQADTGNTFRFMGASGTQTLTTAGSLTTLFSLTENGVGGTLLLADNTTFTSTIFNATNGTFDITGRTATATSVTHSAGTAVLTLTNATLTVSGTGTCFDNSTSGLTINSSGSVIKLTGASCTLAGNGATFGTVWTAASGTDTITGANTLLWKSSADTTTTFPASTVTTLTGMTSLGTSGHNAVIQSSSAGTKATLRKTGAAVTVNNISAKDIQAEGTCFVATSSTNTSGNAGLIFAVNTPTCPTGAAFGGGI